jgi:hypothetical protein
MSEKLQFFTVTIPQEYQPEDIPIIGKRIVQFIKDRTDKGLDKNNKNFHKYSESYIKSLDFKIAGKSSSNVNLQLTGDMIGTLDVLNTDSDKGYITIGYKDGTENDKAAYQQENTQKGFPKRLFLGISDKDLKQILKDNPPTQNNNLEIQVDQAINQDKVVKSIFEEWGLVDNGESP